MGGGACWNSETCSEEGATFTDTIEYVKERQRKGFEGIYNKNNLENPIKEWTHIVIPYCTGDIHWGEKDFIYKKDRGEEFLIHHRGATNTKAVLSWIQSNLESPKDILVTGCSAGSYGSIYWTPHLQNLFPDSYVMQLGDSGAGVITQEFFQNSFPNWHASKNAPTWIPELNPENTDWLHLKLNDLYLKIGNYYPHIQTSQFSSAQDDIQKFFHEIMGGNSNHWPSMLEESFQSLAQEMINFNYYTSAGSEHCILPYDRFYTVKSNNIFFKDWFNKLIKHENIDSIQCDNC